MGVMDKFLNSLKLNDEDSEYDDDYLDDDDDELEEVTKKSKAQDKYDKQEDAPVQKTAAKVTQMKPVRRTNSNGMQVCVIRPTSVEDAREITDTLLENQTVVLNLEGLGVDIAQRIIDFTVGTTYAIHGNLQKISNYIFLVTPQTVDISGDFQEILTGSFEVPQF